MDPKEEEKERDWECHIYRNLMIYTVYVGESSIDIHTFHLQEQ